MGKIYSFILISRVNISIWLDCMWGQNISLIILIKKDLVKFSHSQTLKCVSPGRMYSPQMN